jgi:hypothetical protein
MRGRARNGGFTILELVLATFLAFIVVLAMGRIILTNQRAWEWGRDKTVLQDNVTEVLECMARSVRGADSVAVVTPNEFHTFDEHHAPGHSYRWATVSGVGTLQEDGIRLVDRRCNVFTVTSDHDGTGLTMVVELQDRSGNTIRSSTRAVVRNRTFTY